MSIGMISNRIARFTSALNARVASVLFVVLGAYLAYRHRSTVNIYAILLVFLPVGIQLWGQFRRARGIVNSTEYRSEASKGAVYDLLFFAAIINLLLLILIAALLRHIDGFI
jgi:accessory gene regulator protein AgrB